MEKSTRKNMYLLAVKKVHESLLFTNPYIKYVLVKNERKPKFIIGIFDDIDEINCVYKPHLNNSTVLLENLKYNHPVFSEQTEMCEEGYILSLIDDGFVPVFIDIKSHANLWDHIDYYMGYFDTKKDIIIQYLKFCQSSGINLTLLSEYSDLSINDLYYLYIKNEQMIFYFNKGENFISLNFHEDGYISMKISSTWYPEFKEAFRNCLNFSIDDVVFRDEIQKDIDEVIQKLGDKEHE